ncbi:SagB/ThcOx family dehydrogenase [Pontibacter toksunensis]|uniref:SagB/ThcOx family dehydrogenase n=1 Tax=Pontibacter toksunensis TaxID=1332631 RepID=A0ABW6C159_9BACT
MFDRFNPYIKQALESPSEIYHEASKLRESDSVTARTVWSVNTSPAIKQIISRPAPLYQGFPSIKLPNQFTRVNRPLAEVMLSRRSARVFSGEPISISDLSALLFYSAGVTKKEIDSYGIEWGLRCAPSGGALYPVDVFCISINVGDAEKGLYAYDPKEHCLKFLKQGLFTNQIADATYLTETVKGAAVCILMAINFPRTKFKYGERSYRFALLEAGHIAQNMLLVATSLGIGALPLGGYVDDQINALVGVDGYEQAVVYGILIGQLQDKSH